ncbi:phosphoribosylamine--glycine ligase isoform X1 [Jatropha curcas]|uniref:phosphoribosylamine--glycine ligase isoform X1 n=1 Tax=Jatropha curcas TaxID=180498 RepID=UPI0018952F4E|nr:phosphoribosylamine--glycine ligase isoform X1 [Jatropha curcas]
MSCVTFNLAPSLKLNTQSTSSFRLSNSLPCLYGNSSFASSSLFFLQSLSFCHGRNPSDYSHVIKRSRSFSAVFKCDAAQNSEQSVLIDPHGNGASEERVVVLVIGGGGREHALCYALQRSSSCDAVFCAPGNAGISNSGNATCIPDLDISDSSAVISFCHKWSVGLVVVGPEAPLVAGLANDLVKAGIPTFGPSAEAAALEGSKNFMKSFCEKYQIPTAKYQTFSDPSAAKKYIQDQGAPIVIKADGLAAGKGVIVAMTLEEAYEAVDSMLVKCVFGSAGRRVIVEEFLAGEEASFFALVDGETAIPLESAQDHKRVGDGDTGPNTGGMGAYSPAPILTKELESVVMETIILPTVKGMAAEGCKFVGVLYAGLMIEKKSGLPKLIEYNVRFGDPECHVLMVRLESDLAQVLLAACRGELSGVSLSWSPGYAMVVVMASKGYPGSYEKGTVIGNLEEAENIAPTVKIFHAGTALDANGNFIATGGRVLGITAKGRDLQEARDRAYQAVEEINWPGGFYRQDIGWRALPQNQFATTK